MAAPAPARALGTEAVEDSRPGRVGELDALRGMAIALVLVRHSYPHSLGAGGIVGVEIFFVLSGYLITLILRREHRSGSIDLRRFYRNRIVRLVPALVVALVVNAAWQYVDGVDRSSIVPGLLVGTFFLADLAVLFGLSQVHHMSHLWTLAVEEQFYLVWPAVLVVARRRRIDHGLLVVGSLGLSAVALVATVRLFPQAEPTYSMPTTWVLPLVVGCALALGVIPVAQGRGPALVATVLLLGIAFVPDAKDHAATYLVLVPVIAVLSAVVIANAAGPWPLRLWRVRGLRYLGLVSYSAYLWNQPVAARVGGAPAIGLSILVGTLSYRLVERPFARFKHAGSARALPSTEHLADQGRVPCR